MVNRRTVHTQRQESVPVLQPPDDDLLHRRDAEIMGIVLQYHRNILLLDTLNDILYNFLGILRISGVTTQHIPIKVAIPHLLHLRSQRGHNAGIKLAGNIGTSAGEPYELCPLAGLLINQVVDFLQILKVGFLTGVYLFIVMVLTVHPYGMALFLLPGNHIKICLIPAGHKKGGLYIIFCQNIQKLRRVCAGTIIKSEVNDLSSLN